MAIVTVDDPPSKHLQLESIPLVDLRLLSQSELNSLSLCSNESFDLRRCDDIVIPKIDRSVFNESAGSRKQTYSRLHFAPPEPKHTNIGRNRRFSSGLHSVSKHPTNANPIDDPERRENKRIVTLLRELFAKDNLGTDLVPFCGPSDELLVPEPLNVENGFVSEEFEEGERKRKRGRRRKDDPNSYANSNKNRKGKLQDDSKAIVAWNVQNLVLEIVNRNGEVVDIAALANMNDPFGPELKRRTVGLEKEAELLGFLRGLEGQWGSTRKKRKIVDAGDFGDYLPKGWKILLSLKRKGGQVWLYCRRYISPSGHQFVSMKEVSSYLHSIFGAEDTNQSAEIRGATSLASESIAGLPHRDEKAREDSSYHQASPHAPLSTEHGNQVTSMRVENLAEVEVKDLLVCRKCNTSYDEKDAYLQHLLTSHQSKNKSRLCSSISDGVIINDGKYECQFCHKIFQEKHRYNGHVGNHVKNYVKRLEASPGKIIIPKRIQPSSSSVAPSVICKVDELVDIDKGSTLQTSAKPNDELNFEAPQSKQVTDSVPETSNAKSNNNETSVEVPSSKPAMDSVSGTLSAKSDYDEMNVEAPQSKPVTDSVPETSNAKLNNDEMSVEAPCSTLAMDSVSGTFSAKSDYDGMNVEDPQSTPVTDSIPETSNPKSNNDEMNVEAPLSTPAADSVLRTSYVKSDYNEMNVEAPQSRPVTDSVPETFNAKLNNNEMSVEAPCNTPAIDFVSGTFHAKSDYDEMNVEASQSTPVTDSVPETSNTKSNNDEMNVEAPLSTPVVDSVLGTSNAKSEYKEMNVEAPQSRPVTDSVPETSNAKSNNDEMNVEAPLRTPVADSVLRTSNAKSDYNEMNVEAPQSRPVTDSVLETSNANSNNDEMNIEAPLSTPVADSVLGTFSAKTNFDEMNVEVLRSAPATDSSTSKPNDGSPHCKWDGDSIPETSTPKFNWELHLASPYNKQDRGAGKMKESLADESCDKQYGGYEITDYKLGEIHEPSNNLFGTFNPCLYSASILSSEGNVTSKTSNGEYVFGSTSGEIDKYGLEQEAGSGSCWLTLSIGQQINEVATSVNEGFSLYPKESQLCEAKESGSNVPESCFGTRVSGPGKNIVPETIESTDEGNLLETMVADTSMELMKSSNFFPTFSMISDKGENDFRTVNQKLEKVSDFEELKLDEMDPSKFSFLIGQESNPLQEQSMGLGYDADLEHGLGTSVQFDWESILPNMESRQQQFMTTVCVWCGVAFNLDTVDPAMESDSVGYMCPSCKAKISGQLKYI
ncbi:Methyl-CpG DNA binding [Macleaya cordata]|uniref:Methyl-CpG DNA binding n=1 Tax=Macleaya cordata TaxID=56857 RepID=A0A200PN36_MACCD|nr:Methyl-CpG DNA binding [Macleaya cordata]